MKGKKSQSFTHSLKYAWNGIRRTAFRERNFRIHIFFAIAAVAASIIFQIDTWHFVMVAFAIFFVMSMELVNTAVEAVVDLVTGGKPHPLAKIAKEAAAGAVLIASIFALVVAALVSFSVIRRFL